MRVWLAIVFAATLAAESPDGATPLHWAAYNDDNAKVARLLREGADVNAATDLGVTALWAACQNGNAAIVRMLLEAGAKPDIRLVSGESPLMVAARSGDAEIVRLLLAKGADPNARATRGQTALMWAASQKHPGAVDALLKGGADAHLRSEAWSMVMAVPPHGDPANNRAIPHGGNTALLFAARSGDGESAKILLAAGANVDDTDAAGVSATALAAHSGFTGVVELLLAKGADPNKAGAGFTALHAAIMHRDERMVSALLTNGANPNTPVANWTPTRRSSRDYHFPPALVGATPYWLAARFHLPGIMRLLAKHGADARKENTALLAAIRMKGGSPWVRQLGGTSEPAVLETVRAAVELGAEVSTVSVEAAKAQGFASVARYLQTGP